MSESRLAPADPSTQDGQQPSQPLAPAPKWPGRLICPPGTPIAQWVTSFDRDTDQGRALLFNSQAAPDVSLVKGGTHIDLELKDYVAGWREAPNDDGELVQYPWLVLIDAKGQMFGTSSEPVMHRVAALADFFPGFPGGRTLWVRLSWRTSKKKGREYQDLRVLCEMPVPDQE